MKSVVLSLLLAFIAPLGAVCIADAPHGMACCPPASSAPMARPCCAMGEDSGAVTVPPAPAAVAPAPQAGVVVASVQPCRFRHDAVTTQFSRPIEIRLLSSVILI